MSDRRMIIGMHLGNGYGSQPGAWRMAGVDPRSYASFDAKVRHAQAAERGKLQFLFLPDGPSQRVEIDEEAPNFNPDVMLTLAAVARATSRIGLVATGSTTFNEPYNIARQFKALDVMSHGRAGWNAVTSSGEDVAANYGQRLASSGDRYGRAHEVIQLVQALWGSWGRMHGSMTRRRGSSPEGTGLPRSTCAARMSHRADRSTSRHPNRASQSSFMREAAPTLMTWRGAMPAP